MKGTSYFFNRNGEQIKSQADSFRGPCIVFWMSAMLSPIIAGFVFFTICIDGDAGLALLSLFGGALAGGIAAYLTYPLLTIPRLIFGFGELVVNSYNKEVKIEQKKQATIKSFRCPKCKTQITTNDKECPGCGAAFDWDKI